jgi:hypothetical protein
MTSYGEHELPLPYAILTVPMAGYARLLLLLASSLLSFTNIVMGRSFE